MSRAATLSLVLATASLLLGYLVGQRWAPADEAPHSGPTYAESLTRSLELTPEQVASLERLLAAEDAALRSLVDASREALREPIAARRQQTEDEILTMLDDVQRAEYERLTSR